MMQGSTVVNKAQAFLLKGNAYTLTTLQLNTLDIPHIEATLLDKIKQAPKFFDKIPLVLDLQKLNIECVDDVFLELLSCLRKNRVVPIGLRGGSEGLQQLALHNGLACLSETKAGEKAPKNETDQLKTVPKEKAKAETLPRSATKVITQPVRSGQQIYAPGSDLIVLATVSHGAEILADGNIHVYAPLRGRALAGVMGDTNTYIFCQSLEAELVSIAGQYRISEQLKETAWQQAVQISLADGHLKIDPL